MTAIHGRASVVEVDRNRLLVGGKRFVFRAIRYSDTPLEVLRNAGVGKMDHWPLLIEVVL